MTGWDYEHAYPGGPMVAVQGFPRELHPPQLPGEPVSVDGPDVEAYKRTVSRAGRWRWTKFDQEYSTGFARGKPGGNVGDSGIMGVQRQQAWVPTGVVDRETFNLLRSIRIPDGLPHAGQAAMDARSVELINHAWNLYGGHEPAPPPTNSSAQARLQKALLEVGETEDPPNSNMQKYGHWYSLNGVPWCCIFVTYVDQLSEVPSVSLVRGLAYSYVPYVVSDARLGLNGLSVTSTPEPGSLVCFDWDNSGEHDHIGIVDTPPDSNGNFVTVEGNTSVDDDSNGGQVMRRQRNRYAQGTVFVRVAEP